MRWIQSSESLSITPLVSLVTDYRDTTVNLPIVHGAQKSVALRPTSPISNPRKSKLLPSPIGLCPGERSHIVTPWLSLPQLLTAILSVFVTEIYTAAFYSAVSINFSHQIINGLRYGHVAFSSIFLSPFMPTGSLIGDRLDKTMNPLYSAAICSAPPTVFWQFHLFCPLRILKHAEYLLRPIGLYLGNSCLL